MFDVIAKSLFGTANDRYIKTMHSSIDAINALGPTLDLAVDAADTAITKLLAEEVWWGNR